MLEERLEIHKTQVTWKSKKEISLNPCTTMASEPALAMLQPEEASIGEEGALKKKSLTAGLEACAAERKAEYDGSKAAEKAGLSEVLDPSSDSTVVADELTDEEDDDVYSPFDGEVFYYTFTGEEGAPRVGLLEASAAKRKAEAGCSKAVEKACFQYATFLVDDETTDEEDDDGSSMFYEMFNDTFYAELKARQEAIWEELLADRMT